MRCSASPDQVVPVVVVVDVDDDEISSPGALRNAGDAAISVQKDEAGGGAVVVKPRRLLLGVARERQATTTTGSGLVNRFLFQDGLVFTSLAIMSRYRRVY